MNCHACPLPGRVALAVYTERPRLFSKIWSIPGVRRYQTGDSEMRAVFPIEALPAVARVIRAHRKPGIGAEVAKKIGSITAFGGTSRPQKTRFESSRGPEVNGSGARGGPLPTFLTARQVADMLHVDERTVLRWAQHDASMPTTRLGRVVRFEREPLLRWLARKQPRLARQFAEVTPPSAPGAA
ncbi:MAG: hypothetical protein AUH78_10920 [Gemmatimonadetes bacterium 13_1_40CM_4_69_8]|nr:MAG: hypothetical protein AUH78_10920 [Gemmatimonadetes bacterium 13_1_40CM_4_69_8]